EQRGRSPKGRKDFIDSISLLKSSDLDLVKTKEIIKKYGLEGVLELWKEFLSENYEVEELNLNRHEYAKLKRLVKENL
ncbi:hypothetical protein KKG65_03565, partial [Patescibacteria group bacterium]|nr:hypothetical protein [Patescibacteria group bacterium]